MFKLSELNGRIPDRSIGIHELVQCMHLLVPPHSSVTGKGFVTCVFGGFRLISAGWHRVFIAGPRPVSLCRSPCPDPEATYLFLFNSMSFFFLLTLSAYIIRQLSCCILLGRFNCWGQMNKACIIESMG